MQNDMNESGTSADNSAISVPAELLGLAEIVETDIWQLKANVTLPPVILEKIDDDINAFVAAYMKWRDEK